MLYSREPRSSVWPSRRTRAVGELDQVRRVGGDHGEVLAGDLAAVELEEDDVLRLQRRERLLLRRAHARPPWSWPDRRRCRDRWSAHRSRPSWPAASRAAPGSASGRRRGRTRARRMARAWVHFVIIETPERSGRRAAAGRRSRMIPWATPCFTAAAPGTATRPARARRRCPSSAAAGSARPWTPSRARRWRRRGSRRCTTAPFGAKLGDSSCWPSVSTRRLRVLRSSVAMR